MRRLVMAGGTLSRPSRTWTDRIDNRFGDQAEVVAAGLPQWNPQPAPPTRFPETDHDLIRKQQIEDRLGSEEYA